MIRLRAGAPILLPGAAVIPIEEAHVSTGFFSSVCCVYASKRPTAVVICRSQDTQTFNCEGEAVALGDLLQEVPNLAAVLAECKNRLAV